MAEDLTRASKFLSLLLRHDPGAVGLALDASGWARIDDLERLTAGVVRAADARARRAPGGDE